MKDPTFPSSSHNCQPKLTINFITNITNSIYAKATLTGFGASSWPETEDGQPIIPAKLQVEYDDGRNVDDDVDDNCTGDDDYIF